MSAEQEPRSARSAGAGRYNVVFLPLARVHSRRGTSSPWKCGLPFGPRSARGQGMDSPWTALRPAHRLPTPLPTGSTLNPHSHRHTQHHQVEFLIFRGRKTVRSDVVPYRQNTRKRTPIRSLEGAFFFSFVFNDLWGGGSARAMHYPPCTSYALPLVHFCVVFTQVCGKDKLGF